MKDYIKDRVNSIGAYIAETSCTIRRAAAKYNISKSTVHKDLSERLPIINPPLAKRVKAIMDKNKAERHIRGGLATKRKYGK